MFTMDNPIKLARIAVVAAISACGLSPAAAAERDTLTIGLTQYPATLNPAIDSMLAKSYVLGLVQRPITVYDKDWKLVCLLCTELPTLENGGAKLEDRPDGTKGIAVTYRLLPKATWGDGTPVTARDVRFTWEVGRHPQSGAANGEAFRRITDVEIVDDKTAILHVDRVTFDYNAFGLMLLPAHLEAQRFEDPAQYRVRTLYETQPTNPGLYAGPYRISQVVAGSHIVVERNPHWWGKTPAFRRIVVRAIENTAALESNLLSGSIDMAAGELGLSLEQVMALEQRNDPRFAVLYKPSLTYEHIDLNLDNPILKDVRVRHALLLALDREAISRQLFGGKQPVAHSFVNTLDWIYDPDGLKYGFDRAAAIKLLEQAGWTQLRNGIRHNAAGQPLSLEINTTAGNRGRELLEQVLQSEWRKVGIDVKIRNMTARVLFGDFMDKRRYPAMALFGWMSSPENVPRSILHSDQVPTEANNWQGQNFTGYRDPDTDVLLDKVERELDRERRKALWYALQRRYAEALPVLPLFFRSTPFVLPKWLGGIEPTGHQFSTTLWVEDWTVAP
jgi:peptide/nickel transport system substrate-binding protein